MMAAVIYKILDKLKTAAVISTI